jgi:hypothetical protein
LEGSHTAWFFLDSVDEVAPHLTVVTNTSA